LLLLIQKYFGCGILSKIYEDKNGDPMVTYEINNIASLYTIIVPFFKKYTLRSTKYYDFLDFAQAVNLIYHKEHLTTTGKEKIHLLKNQMNTLRTLPVDFIPSYANPTAPEFIPMNPNYLSGFTG